MFTQRTWGDKNFIFNDDSAALLIQNPLPPTLFLETPCTFRSCFGIFIFLAALKYRLFSWLWSTPARTIYRNLSHPLLERHHSPSSFFLLEKRGNSLGPSKAVYETWKYMHNVSCILPTRLREIYTNFSFDAIDRYENSVNHQEAYTNFSSRFLLENTSRKCMEYNRYSLFFLSPVPS